MSNYPCIASSVLSVTAQSPNELVTIPDNFRLAHYLQSYAYIGKCPSVVMGATKKMAYPVQRAPALCGVWGRVSVASLTLACAMRGDRDSNLGPSGHRR